MSTLLSAGSYVPFWNDELHRTGHSLQTCGKRLYAKTTHRKKIGERSELRGALK
jgi:hypothetical protein